MLMDKLLASIKTVTRNESLRRSIMLWHLLFGAQQPCCREEPHGVELTAQVCPATSGSYCSPSGRTHSVLALLEPHSGYLARKFLVCLFSGDQLLLLPLVSLSRWTCCPASWPPAAACETANGRCLQQSQPRRPSLPGQPKLIPVAEPEGRRALAKVRSEPSLLS